MPGSDRTSSPVGKLPVAPDMPLLPAPIPAKQIMQIGPHYSDFELVIFAMSYHCAIQGAAIEALAVAVEFCVEDS